MTDNESTHDTRGLFNKYRVLKQNDEGTWVEKTTACFVLSPDKDDAYGAASKAALLAYANAIEEQNRQLALDLVQWLRGGEHRCGDPGVRDTQAPCLMYEPGAPHRSAGCSGDGHYLCKECAHFLPRSDEVEA